MNNIWAKEYIILSEIAQKISPQQRIACIKAMKKYCNEDLDFDSILYFISGTLTDAQQHVLSRCSDNVEDKSIITNYDNNMYGPNNGDQIMAD